MSKRQNRNSHKIAIWIVSILVTMSIAGIIYLRNGIFKPFQLEEPAYIYIDNEKNFEDVIKQLQEKAGLPSEKLFRLIAERMNYIDNIKTGRYAVKDGMTMPELIRTLRSGNQTPVNLTFNNIRTKEALAGRISQQLMLDSITLIDALNDSATVSALGFDTHTIPAMFIPNTYQVYWDTGVSNFLSRMKREYNVFWNDNRKAMAEKTGLSPIQISILASIVEEEATYVEEYSTIAGLYLNRLRKGIKLEADPTIKFAIGDFSLQRILFEHLTVDSPYNTYKHTGLPPGPIRIPSIKAIDSTLNPTKHNYLYMCAKEDLSGKHNFAENFAQHAINAARYRNALNKKGIY